MTKHSWPNGSPPPGLFPLRHLGGTFIMPALPPRSAALLDANCRMLEVFRKASRTWIAKILFGILVLSFAVWGVGDMVNVGVSNAPAITAGDVEIPADAVVAEYKREVNRLQRVFGSAFTEEQARSMGLLERTIDNMVARGLLDHAANDLDMVAPDTAVRQRIQDNPAFRNAMGQFDAQLFRQAIAQAGFAEPQFIEMARHDLLRGQLIGAVAEGMQPPTQVAETIYKYRNEKRTVESLTFEASRMPAPPTPTDEVLKQYWEAHQDRFMAPEFRALTAIILRPSDVAGEVTVTDAMVEEAYQQRLAEFQEPERRNARQILFQDEAAAKQAGALAQQGKDLDAIAQEMGQQVLELGWVDRQSLEVLAAELAEAAFTAQPGTVAQPVQTSLGWHLLQVREVQPGESRSLAEVRDQLVQDLVQERAIDVLYEMANKVDDTLASGASLEEAADKLGLRLVKADAVDVQGRDAKGQPVPDLPQSEKFLSTAFTAEEGVETRMTEMENNNGFFIARVDKVIAPAVKPFDTVKTEVLASWQAEQQLAAARTQAEQAAERLRQGETVAAVGAAMGIEPQVSQPFTRTPTGRDLPVELVSQAFTLQPGGVATVSTPKGAMVAQLEDVQPADPKADATGYAELRAALSEGYSADVIDQYVSALNAAHGASVNREVIESRLR